MNFNDLSQQEVNDYFVNACSKGHIHIVQKLYKDYRPYDSNFYNNSIRKVHKSFLNLFSLNKPILKISYNQYEGLKRACENGRTDIVKFLVSLPEFSSPLKIYDSPKTISRLLTDCIEICLCNFNFNIANLLFPFIENNTYFELTMQHNFLKACLEGKFNIVQYLLTNRYLEKYHHAWLNGETNEFISSHQGFIYACENGHLKIVKYLTSSYEIPEHVNIDLIEKNIRIKNKEVVQYLISHFNLDEGHPFISKIDFHPKSQLKSMLEHKSYLKKIKVA